MAKIINNKRKTMTPETRKEFETIAIRSLVLVFCPTSTEDEKEFFKARHLACKSLLKYEGNNAKIEKLPLLINKTHTKEELIGLLKQYKQEIKQDFGRFERFNTFFNISKLKAIVKTLINELETTDFANYDLNENLQENRTVDAENSVRLVDIEGIGLLIDKIKEYRVKEYHGISNQVIFNLASELEMTGYTLIKNSRTRV